MSDQPLMPSQVDAHVGLFDRFAGATARQASRAPFFAFCVLLIAVWAPSFLFLPFDTWQLIINTATTIITFLLVALLQNSQARDAAAMQQKLNAIADALADLMHDVGGPLTADADELRAAVGLERRSSTS